MVKRSAFIFVGAAILIYFLMTYSYAGYTPDFPAETRNRKFIKGTGYVLETESVADIVADKKYES
jgi:hypothetical protein